MVKESKYFESQLDAAIAVRAEVLGVARDFTEQAYFLGIHLFVSDKDPDKYVYGIAVRSPYTGITGLVMTKSDNVIRQIDEIMTTIGDYPRDRWCLRFEMVKTKEGRQAINVILSGSPVDHGRKIGPIPEEIEDIDD